MTTRTAAARHADLPPPRRAGSATCAARERSRTRPGTRCATPQLRRNLGHATSTIRAKRAAVVAEVADWEELREAGRQLKVHTMAHLADYLVQLEEAVTARGGVVHWARDAAEANRIVVDLVRAKGVDEVVKVKSMATQEIGLNEALEDGRHRGVGDRPRRADRAARATTSHRTSWCRRSTATGPRSARSSCARWPASTRT